MKIDRVTITGADNDTTYSELVDIQDQFQFVEWGILFSESKEGTPRYPSAAHRAKHFVGILNLSAHFCGWWARQILEDRNFKLITDLPKQYKRVQLNYNFKNSQNWNLTALLTFCQKNPDRDIILQYNGSNNDTIREWLSKNPLMPHNIHFLYDSSGGRGTVIQLIKDPIKEFYTGYAGGINLANIDTVCADIGRRPNPSKVWIDLESGARVDDNFDLTTVTQILHNCTYHIARS